MGKIEQNKERKRREILTAAQDIFLSEGYLLASMDKISAQAKMTKQTVYRYFPSKADLFQATLKQMGEGVDESFLTHLQHRDPREALLGFAKAFLDFHLSDNHMATFRLLVAESVNAPEIVRLFHAVGPDETEQTLCEFFSDRLEIQAPESKVRLWTGMLLSLRAGVLMGMENPTPQQRADHAQEATDFLLAALR